MKRLVVLSLLLCLTGCLTPHAFRSDHGQKSGRYTTYNVTDYEDGFRVENEGVAPDIEVEQWPELVIKGHDPQLEKAIEIALKELSANPTKKIQRPAYPIKTKN